MLLLQAVLSAILAFSPPPAVHRASSHARATTAMKKQMQAAVDDAEEAYWRRWFWDQAEEAIEERFASASKRDLKRVREYVAHNRDDKPLPKKLDKHPHYEVIGGYFPGLTTTPFLDASGAPWTDLSAAYPGIKEELDAMRSREQEFIDVGKPLGWKTMQIFYRGELHPDFPADKCPQTMQALSGLRLAGETVAFQRQQPGTGLPRHVDPCSWVVACHLGMQCPGEGDESPFIWVAGDKYHWRDGKAMIFECAPTRARIEELRVCARARTAPRALADVRCCVRCAAHVSAAAPRLSTRPSIPPPRSASSSTSTSSTQSSPTSSARPSSSPLRSRRSSLAPTKQRSGAVDRARGSGISLRGASQCCRPSVARRVWNAVTFFP